MVISTSAPIHLQDQYWEKWLADATLRYEYYASLDKDRMKYINENLYNIMKLAIENKQYRKPLYDEEKVSRLCKIQIPLSRAVVERTFHVTTYNIRGSGLYVLLEGIFYTESFRRNSGYDEKSGNFNISSINPIIREEYDFRLTTPAMGGLFIPLKSELTSWLKNIHSIEFFDITL